MMKKIKFVFSALFLAVAASMAVGCSDKADDEEFRSKPPIIADLEVKMLDGGTQLTVGDKMVATLVQKSKGRLLNGATYEWSVTPLPDSVVHNYKRSVIYDKGKANPTDTLQFKKPGTYTLKFTGAFKISGSNSEHHNSTVEIPDGEVTYRTEGLFRYIITATKTIKVGNK